MNTCCRKVSAHRGSLKSHEVKAYVSVRGHKDLAISTSESARVDGASGAPDRADRILRDVYDAASVK